MINFFKNIKRKIRITINKIGAKRRAKKISKNYTLISNNCWGGLTYEYLGQEFKSPTIGLYFMSDEYLKFISNLKYYIAQNLKFIDTSKSRYYNYLKSIKQEKVIIGVLDDVEIVFLHYKNAEEAYEKWNKRVKRIDFDNIIYKFNDQNLCTVENLEKFSKMNLKNKICFTAKKYNYDGFIQIVKYRNCDFVKDDAYSYHRYFDVIDYINSR